MPNRLPDYLSRLLAYHENAVAHIRAVMDFIARDEAGLARGRRLKNGHMPPPIFRDALALDAKRRGTAAATGKANREQRRASTLALLNLFNTSKPVTADTIPSGKQRRTIGALVRRGYLHRKGGGFVRTAKPFHITPPRKSQAAR